jgi:hypothetical protein
MTLILLGEFNFTDDKITGENVLPIKANKHANYYKVSSSLINDELLLSAYGDTRFEIKTKEKVGIQAIASGKTYGFEEKTSKTDKKYFYFTISTAKKTYISCSAFGMLYDRIKLLVDKYGENAFDLVEVTGLYQYTEGSNGKRYQNILINSFDILRWRQAEDKVTSKADYSEAPPIDLPNDDLPPEIVKVEQEEWKEVDF